ncbi:unnamed protein product [Victoria cruziana]
MVDLVSPSPSGPRSAADLFGDPVDSRPLWFKKDGFLQKDFDPEAYVSDLRRFVPLDSLRNELRSHLSILKNELIELINRDYGDFVNLSTKLVDVNGAILRMRAPLTELRGKISQFRASVEVSLSALHDGLRQRAEASAAREILELLLDTSHVVSKVEKLILELPSVPADWSNADAAPMSKTSLTSITLNGLQTTENGANQRETQSILLERIASEMNRLNFYVAHAQNLPFIQNMESRIQSARTLLENSLGHCFIAALEHRDANAIYNCLRAYAAIDNTEKPEEVFRSTVVSPLIQEVIPQSSSLADGTSSDELQEDYKKIKELIRNNCKFLLDIAATTNSGLHVFDFLANSILKEVLLAIQRGKPGVLSPGKPTEFLKNYKASLDFLAYLEGYCPSRSAIIGFRSRAVYIEFIKLWNIGVYFSLRFQEIASVLDSSLMVATITPVLNLHPNENGNEGLTLNQSVVLMESLRTCWKEDVLVVSCSDKFLRLSLQLVSRYTTWLSSGLAAREKGSSSSGAGSEWGLAASPDDFIYVLHDVGALVSEITGEFLVKVLQLLASCPAEVLAQVKKCISQSAKKLEDLAPAVMDTMIDTLVEKSVEDLRQLKGITATYRMTNKPPPVRHSPYVSGVLRPLKSFLEGEKAVFLNEDARRALLVGAAEKITNRYNELAGELVSVARKTESSLLRIRQGAQRRAGASSDASENNISDTDKICMQLFLDIQEYGRNLAAFGVVAAEIPAYRSLWQCVAPQEKQELIHF